MLYRDIIPSDYATAADVAKLVVDGDISMNKRMDIFTKLNSDPDKRRWKAVGVELKKQWKAKRKSERKFKSPYVHKDGGELFVAAYVQNVVQLELALLYQYEILPYILHRFNRHFGENGAARKYKIMQKQAEDLMNYCSDTLSGECEITLKKPMSKPEFKQKAKQVLIYRFMNMGIEGYKINKTNAVKLVDTIFQYVGSFEKETDHFEVKQFDMIFKSFEREGFVSVEESLKSYEIARKKVKNLFEL